VLRAVVLTQYRHVTDGRTDRQTELLVHCIAARGKNEINLCKNENVRGHILYQNGFATFLFFSRNTACTC